MKNRDVYLKDPTQTTLLNDGVAEVAPTRDEAALRALRYELETFVCQGAYAEGLRKILETYLTHVGRPVQPCVWVSGFFGSGKSHLLKVLCALWVDERFPDGATARGIVTLPPDIRALLTELSTAGRRHGGLHAVSGKLGAGASGNPRREVVEFVFRSLGLPASYPIGRFALWLRHQGLEEAVRAHVEAAGADWDYELHHFLVSHPIAEALLAAQPDFAPDVAEARRHLRASFFEHKDDDISTDAMVRSLEEALGQGGHFPLTVVGLDEVQQYIGEHPDRSYGVQEIAETCAKHFGGRLLLVATGQTALAGTPLLHKLMGRFTVRVELSDADVQAVIRQVILAKKPDKVPAVEQVLEDSAGEIARHLEGTKLAPRPEDQDDFVADYPILPVRRRLWERLLRAVDQGGTAGQLRNQLKVVHNAARATAEDPLGCVVSADFLYDELAPTLLQTGVLPREVFEHIEILSKGSEDDRLAARVYALVFLLGTLPQGQGADHGVRATPEVLADLLVADLRAGSTSLRQRVASALRRLRDDGLVLLVGDAYRLQTREGARWEQVFRQRRAAFLDDPQRLDAARTEALRARCRETLRPHLRVTQGKTKQPRKVVLHFGTEPPKDDAAYVPVWVRTGWEVTTGDVRKEAGAAGQDSCTVFVHLPRRGADALREALATRRAAEATLDEFGEPSTPEGREARTAMETRRAAADEACTAALDAVLAGARVFLGGGEEVEGKDLTAKVLAAVARALARRYPEFPPADDPRWAKVLRRAQEGDASALEALGYDGTPAQHPVVQEVLEFIGTGHKGSEVRDHFAAPPYGWPRDAVDGAIYVLVVTGAVLVHGPDGKAIELKALERRAIAKASLRRASVQLTTKQRLDVRKLLLDVLGKGKVKPEKESDAVPAFLETLRARAAEAGGDPPAPPPPSTEHLEAIASKAGNEQLLALYEQCEVLRADAARWAEQARAIAARLPVWQRLVGLLEHARSAKLDGVEAVDSQVEAVRKRRRLLDEPDPVAPLLRQVEAALRAALKARVEAYREAYEQGLAQLEALPAWKRLDEEARRQQLAKERIEPPSQPDVGDSAKLLAHLGRRSLAQWDDRIDALPQRFARLAKALEPPPEPPSEPPPEPPWELPPEPPPEPPSEPPPAPPPAPPEGPVVVALPRRPLASRDDLRRWLDEVEKRLAAALAQAHGPVVVEWEG